MRTFFTVVLMTASIVAIIAAYRFSRIARKRQDKEGNMLTKKQLLKLRAYSFVLYIVAFATSYLAIFI